MSRFHLVLSIPLIAGAAAVAQPHWEVINPATTGIPGEEVRIVRFAPDGRMWVGARWPFWSHGGFGVYDFNQNAWEVHSNVPNSAASGFPSAFPNDIEFAPDGSVWAATEQGLAHLVNGQWNVFTSANTPMPYHDVRAIDIDSQGRIWLNVRKGPQYINARIFVYDGSIWKSWGVGAGIPWPTPWEELNGVLVDAADHVWVGNSTQSGLAEFDGVNWSIHGQGIVPPLRGPFEDAFGNKWAIEENLGYAVYRYDGSTWQAFSSANTPFVQTTITALAEDDQGRLLIANWAGQVIRQTAPGASTFALIADIGIRAYNLNPMPGGELYLSSPGAVRHLDAFGNQIRAFNTYNTGLPDYFIDNFSLDRAGFFWVATGEGGISRFDGKRWRNWGNHNAGSEPYPWAGNEPMGGFYLDASGHGWMGGNGIGRWDPQTGQFTGFWNWQNNPGMGVTLFTHFAEDKNGTLFAASENGFIMSFNGSLWVANGPNPGGYTSNYAGIYSDSQGNVYGAGLWDINVWNGSAWSKLPLPNPNYLFDLGGVTAFAVGPNDTLWIGTNEGLLRYDGQFTLYNTTNSPLPALQVQGIDVRDDGLIAVSAHEFGSVTPFPTGVVLIDGDPANPANWTTYAYGKDPIPHYQLGDVAFDASGDLWVSAISEGAAILRMGGSCYPDCDQSGSLDLFDFLCFVNEFNSGNPYADCDGSGTLDIFDFLCFLNAFNAGCP